MNNEGILLFIYFCEESRRLTRLQDLSTSCWKVRNASTMAGELTGMERKCVKGCFALAVSASRLMRVRADRTPLRIPPEITAKPQYNIHRRLPKT